MEKRLISFRELKERCNRDLSDVCMDSVNNKYLACSSKNCPVWKKLPIFYPVTAYMEQQIQKLKERWCDGKTTD